MTALKARLLRLEKRIPDSVWDFEQYEPLTDQEREARIEALMDAGQLWRDDGGWHGKGDMPEAIAAVLQAAKNG